MAIATSAMEIRSPAVSSMSSSRPGGSSVTCLARSSSSSVVSPMAETTTTTSSPSFFVSTMRSATRLMRSAAATEDPPYFWTTRATGPQATDVAARDRRLRPRPARDVITGWTIPRHWLLSADERGNPHTDAAGLDRGQPRRAADARQRLLRPAGRRGASRWTPATTCSSPTGGATPTSGCAPDGPTVAELFTDGGQAGRVRPRAGLALAHATQLSLQQGGQPRPGPGDRARPAARCCSTSGSAAMGSHHQKFVVLRHDERPAKDVAFVGGIDLCHSRRDDAEHRGDPQAAADGRGLRADTRRGTTCSCRCAGPAVGVLDTVFRERWDDPNSPDADHPIAWIHDKLHHARMHADPLPPQLPTAAGVRPAPRADAAHLSGDPAAATPSRPTASARWPAATPRRSRRARRLIYLEDQYLWSAEVARPVRRGAAATTRTCTWSSSCPGSPTRTARSPSGRSWSAGGRRSRCAGGPGADRVHVFDVENHAGTPVYVHAKVCVVDDVWASVGSDNFNRRSWTHDSELSSARARHHPRPARAPRPGRHRRRRARLRPRPAADAGPRAPGPARRRQRGRRPARPGRGSSRPIIGERRRAATLARRRPAGPAAARPAAPAPAGAAAAGHPALGDARSTGWSTTPTAGRCGCASRRASEPGPTSAPVRPTHFLWQRCALPRTRGQSTIATRHPQRQCALHRLASTPAVHRSGA